MPDGADKNVERVADRTFPRLPMTQSEITELAEMLMPCGYGLTATLTVFHPIACKSPNLPSEDPSPSVPSEGPRFSKERLQLLKDLHSI
jgi:hypothetical protein